MVPTGTGEAGKTGRNFSVREKSGNFYWTGKIGKFTQNNGKIRNLIN